MRSFCQFQFSGAKGPVINYGDTNGIGGGGGQIKFYPYKKGGVEKDLAMLKGGTQRVFQVVVAAQKVTVSNWGGGGGVGPGIFPFCSLTGPRRCLNS